MIYKIIFRLTNLLKNEKIKIMRPFRYFFGLSLGVLLLLFLARFVLTAFVIAAMLSVAFYIGKRLKNFFLGINWDDEDYVSPRRRFSNHYARRPQVPVWKDDLLMHYPNAQKVTIPNSRTIEII